MRNKRRIKPGTLGMNSGLPPAVDHVIAGRLGGGSQASARSKHASVTVRDVVRQERCGSRKKAAIAPAEADAAVAAFLARGGQVTRCPTAYVLPVAGK